MKKIKTSNLSPIEVESLVKACKDIDGGPWPGVLSGTGRQVPMPATVTEADLWSNNRAKTLGWTFHGPQGRADIEIPISLCDAIDGEEGEEKVRNASVLAHARNALKKAELMPLAAMPAQEVKAKP